ncbi:McrB family protein [Hymenobacter sp. 102]|uniref:McrB family protein n=1 Tax=Hymenobacter sp. 102 TaxID=3403152 RepID=UPI003CF98B08
MSKYISLDRIVASIQRSKSTGAETRLSEFLIFKRALKLSGGDTVPLGLRETPLRIATNDYMSCDLATPSGSSQDSGCLVNYFAFRRGDFLRQTPKFYSNGAPNTLAGNAFKPLLHTWGERPVKAKLADQYEDQLASTLIQRSGNSILPRIDDVAIWFYRNQDVESLVGRLPSYQAIQSLVDVYRDESGLTNTEIDALFDTNIPASEYGDLSWLQDSPADPADYLPASTTTRASASAPRSIPAVNPGSISATSAIPSSVEGCDKNLVVALAAKGFVILSGPSGTGKSRGALHLASSLEAVTGLTETYNLIPVGADWTDSRHLLGYRNPFGPKRTKLDGAETHESYEVTDTLKLLLRSVHPDRQKIPHFLILDEMNLSHVERYFSSFLSLMEANRSVSGVEIPLLSADTIALINEVLNYANPESIEAGATQALVEAGNGLVLPYNFCIVGTINVDETTYMFSPKVLDRAHVIEILSVQPGKYIGDSKPEEPSLNVDAALAVLSGDKPTVTSQKPHEGLVELAIQLGYDHAWVANVIRHTTILLDGAYKLLEPIGFAFGYRLVNEVFRYLQEWVVATWKVTGAADPELNWVEALDNAFLQKVLPKVHGNRRQLGDCLPALISFLSAGDSTSASPARYKVGTDAEVSISPAERFDTGKADQMRKTISKVARMNRRLLLTNYATFVE